MRDIGKSLIPLLVQPRIQEAQRPLTRRDTRIVDQRENTGCEWTGGTGAADGPQRPVPEEGEVEALC